MMRLLCIGDVALLNKTTSIWPPPSGINPNDNVRILLNWELPLGVKTNPIPRTSGPRLLSQPDSVNVIRNWAPGFAALATNHILDAGEDGLEATMFALQQAGFQSVGAGLTADTIKCPLFWETSEGRLAVVNWVFPETHPDWNAVPGPNCWPGVDEAKRTIHSLKYQADWVLVLVHWSDEDFSYPRPEDREIARQLIQMGADLIIGHHPHVVRGIERFNDSFIFYSLGNFYFSNFKDGSGKWIARQAPRNKEGLGVELIFQRGRRPQYQLHSYYQTKKGYIQDPFHRAARRANSVSRPFIKLSEPDYIQWYAKQRAAFDQWGFRLYFRLWQFGLPGLVRFAAKKLHLAL